MYRQDPIMSILLLIFVASCAVQQGGTQVTTNWPTTSSAKPNNPSGIVITNSTTWSNSSSGTVVTNSTSSSNSSSGTVVTNSTSSSSGSSGTVVTNSTSSSNSSSGTVITNSTTVITNSSSSSNSSSGTVVTNSTSSSNSSSGTVITNSTTVITNSTSWSNSSYEWSFRYSWAGIIYFSDDYTRTLIEWLNYFSQAQSSMNVSQSQWSYAEWSNYSYSHGGFGCNSRSIIQIESAIILNILEAISMKFADRTAACVSIKESIALAKSILTECEDEMDKDFESSSMVSVIHFTTTALISEFKTTQHLICSSYDEDSSSNTGSDSGEGEGDGQMCEMNKIRDNLLAFIRLELSWESNGAGCSDASMALDTIMAAEQSCSWEVRSALSLIISEKRNFWITMCSPPTCNIPYADISLSSALMLLAESGHHNVSNTQNATEGICRSLKFVLATAMNHTVDCQSNIYSSISRKIDLVKKGYVARCGALPAAPQTCVVARPSSDIFSTIASSFFFDRPAVCQAARMFNASSASVGHYCDMNVTYSQSLLPCLQSNCSDRCDNSTGPMNRQYAVGRACLLANGVSNSTLRKLDYFLLNLQRYVLVAGNTSACYGQEKYDQLIINASVSILTGESDPNFCMQASDVIGQWVSSCGNNVSGLSSNITALFSLVCPRAVQVPNCSYPAITGCFRDINMALSDMQHIENLNQCVRQAVANCSGPIANEAQETLRQITSAGPHSPVVNNSAPCTCDPAAAVNCIMEVHHLSKQITPDWQGICPLVQESETCSRSYVQGCDECKKSTVLEIVHKLNSQLEDVCIAPPVSECSSVSAMQCVTELSHFQESASGFGNDTICIKITIARQCVFEKTEKCDELTILSVMRTLEQVTMRWKGLVCQPPEDQLKNCTAVFESRVYEIFGINMNSLLISVQNNQTVLWNKFTNFCQEAEFSFQCINASLNLERDNIQAVIVRQTFDAFFKIVTKVCKPPMEQLQCYSCEGSGQFSCANRPVTETCRDNEICETTTSIANNLTVVAKRGCTPRPACKAGCDKNGCTYCCSDKLCNSRNDGPIEGMCNMTAVAGCVFSLSASYIQTKDFQCSDASAALGCVSKLHLECEIGGMTATLDSLATLDLSAEVHQCLIEEANQTCDVATFATTCAYVGQALSSQFARDDLCGIIADSRSRVSRAASVCSKDKYLVIKQTQTSIEAVVGYLDCKEKFNFTINVACKPFNALVCARDLNSSLIGSNSLCQSVNNTVNCMKPQLVECSSVAQIFIVEDIIKWLLTFISTNTTCTDVTLIDNKNLTFTEVTRCMKEFSSEITVNGISSFFNATMRVQSCLFNINQTVISSLSVTESMSFETLLQFIEIILEIDVREYLHLDVQLQPACTSLIGLVNKHVVTVFGMPFTPLDQREALCGTLDVDLTSITASCYSNGTADIFRLIDTLRISLIAGFCPGIQPVTRCLISRAEECYARFTASFGYVQSDSLCLEADIFVECAINYTQTCDSSDLTSFYQRTAFVADFVSQACTNRPELITKTRCGLRGRVNVQPGCNNSGISQCTNTQKDKCGEVEKNAACLAKNAGSCISSISPSILNQSLSEISQCRYGDQSHSTDTSILTQSCSTKPYSCDFTKALNCLNSLLAQPFSADNEAKTKSCLEENFYCFFTVADLISIDITHYSTLIWHIRGLTPSWGKLESKYLIMWLRITSNFNYFFSVNEYVSMNLWDMCWELNVALVDVQMINSTYPNEGLPATDKSIRALKSTLMSMCNNLGEVAEELELPPNGIENPTCPVNLTSAYIYIMFSQATTEFFSAQNVSGDSVCSLYIKLNQSLEASVEAGLSFSSCSSGFHAKVRFALKIVQSIVGNRCQVPDYDVRRCDFQRVERCVSTLYQNFISLGENQTVPGLCQVFEETEMCVEKYSYMCDSCTSSRIQWLYSSTKQSVQLKCAAQMPPPECDDEIEEPDECDYGRATACSIKQFRNFLSPIMAKDAKCRSMNENLNCISKATTGCTGVLPRLVNQGVEKAKNFLSDLGCKDGGMMNMSSGCREGCWVNRAYKCIAEFKSQIAERMESSGHTTICQYLSELNLCVGKNTVTCQEKESESVTQALEIVVEKFQETHASCVDVFHCSADFTSLVQQILNLSPEEEEEGDEEDDLPSSGNNDGDDEEEEENDEEGTSYQPSLNTLCVKVKQAWACVEKGLDTLSGKKKQILLAMYTEIWEVVEEKCSNTRELECYYCENTDSFKSCESNTETCSPGMETCIFRQTLSGSSVKYSAGCSRAKQCISDKSDEHTYYCSTGLCNKKANVASTCPFESVTCRLDLSLSCALRLSTHYLESESINCSDVILNLGCIQKYSFGCSNSKTLLQAVNKIFLSIASTTCVVDASSNDCDSLAINYMKTLLGSAFISEGNSVCLAMQQTSDSVNELIAGGNCSVNGRVSLKLILSFISSIVGNYCSDEKCSEREIEEYLDDDSQTCSGNIFNGIKSIYTAYKELAKNESTRDCGHCADNALSARKYLKNCDIGNVVTGKMDTLDHELTNQCHVPDHSNLPEVCSSVCQSSVVLNYTDQVSAAVSVNGGLVCWYLGQLQEVYLSYTSGCISVQQRDVASYVHLAVGRYITQCEQKYPDFSFDLELRKDIYYGAMVCNDNFQAAIKRAFLENDQKAACDAVNVVTACNWNLPKMVADLVTNSSLDIINLFKESGICGDLGNITNRNRRDAAVCQLDRLSSLIATLVIPPNIAISTIDSRNKFCQSTATNLKEAETLTVECSDGLSTFQLTLYRSIKKNVETKSKKSCRPLLYEQEQCDLQKMAECRLDYERVSGYATVEMGSLCRTAKFGLECSTRFSTNCTSNDSTTALAIQETFTAVIKQSVGNSCPLLTLYFFCNKSLSGVQPACLLDDAKKCRSALDFDFTKTDDPKYCPALQKNVSCVQNSASGCQADQIATIGWPTTARNGMCNITDATLNNVCQSVPVCSTTAVLACFAQAKVTSCQSLQVAVACMSKYFSSNKQCQQSLGYSLVQYYLSVYYSTLAPTCGVVFNSALPSLYAQSYVGSLVMTIDIALSIRKDYSAADILYYFYSVLLTQTLDVRYTVISEIIINTFNLVYNNATETSFRPTGQTIVYNNITDVYYKDTSTCFYSRARACLALQISRTFTFKLQTLDERNALCDDLNANSVETCITESLSSCPQGDKDKFLKISKLSSLIVDRLGFCEKPHICLVSEAYECVNKFGTILATFDRDNDTKTMCLGRLQSQECMDSFLFKCDDDEASPVRETFKSLSVKVDAICETVVLPEPPICPDIRERNRVCILGNAFLCLANFNNRILMTSDSLIWRQQCLEIQKMMVCIATNTTSCDPANADVKIIQNSLKDFKAAAGLRCPWLTEDLCSVETPCPVMTSGCDTDMERKLMNKDGTVCSIKEQADHCVENYTDTCTKAQREQALTVISKKMVSLGLPKELSCQAGSIDGCLYSFLSASRDIYISSSRSTSCSILASQYSCIVGRYSNLNNSKSLDLAKKLIDSLNTILTAAQCTAPTASTCTTPVPVNKLKVLITQLALNSNFSTTSFCAQSQTIFLEKTATDCNGALYSIISESELYRNNCVNEVVSCDAASAKIRACVSQIGVFSSLSCTDKQRAAICVTDNLPANCPYDPKLLDGNLCNDTVVLQASGNQGKKNFVSESGLSLNVRFKLVAGTRMFELRMTSRAENISKVPSCLEGSKKTNPIAQIYTGMNPQTLNSNSSEVAFTIYARQDLRTDGPQAVIVKFEIIPTVETINASSGVKTVTQLNDKNFTISTFTVNVEDSDNLNSLCSAINDPHYRTFDSLSYSNMDPGNFIMYRHTALPEAVVVHNYKCSSYGTCVCGVTVFSGDSTVTLSNCIPDEPFVSFGSESKSLAQQTMSTFFDESLNTYHVILKATSSIVTVENTGQYLQVYIQPSPLVAAKSQGQCGSLDNDAFNDLEFPDGSILNVTSSDTEFGVLIPRLVNLAWKVNTSDALNWRKIYYPGVVPTTVDVGLKCITVNNGSGDIVHCSDLAGIATCGFVDGEDQAATLLALSNQETSTTSNRRKKRQVIPDDVPTNETGLVIPGWPTKSGRTLSEATDYCMDTLFNGPLQACTEAILSISSQLPNFDNPLKACVDDIRITDSTFWVDGAQRAALQVCSKIVNQNPDFQSNNGSSDLAMAFLNTTCRPSNCSGHGTCFRGHCICDKNYVGTSCDVNISNLRPPVLVDPMDGLYTCEIGLDSDCSSVFLQGTNLVSSDLLSCHIRTVQITQDGVIDLSTGVETIVRAQLIATNQVRCDLGTKSIVKRTLQLSVSNDGKVAYEKYQTFIAYDPVCYDCNYYSCSKNSKICIIGNRCLREGETSVYSDCQYCNLTNPNSWSIRLEIPGCENMIPPNNNNVEKDSDKQTLITALIAVGCSVVVLLIILIGVCVFMKRREAKRKCEAARRIGTDNRSFRGDMPFSGQPVTAFKPAEWADNNLLPPKYQVCE